MSVLDDPADQALEKALQQEDFEAIRSILHFEYGIPAHEPNDFFVPDNWLQEEVDPPPEDVPLKEEGEEMSELKRAEMKSLFKSVAEVMAQRFPIHLEHAIRKRSTSLLRLWLKMAKRNIRLEVPGDDPTCDT